MGTLILKSIARTELVLKSYMYIRKHGFRKFIHRALEFAFKSRTLRGKSDLFEFYSFMVDNDQKSNQRTSPIFFENERTINWFIPPFGKGSGGHLNIFRFVRFLEEFGYTCRIVIVDVNFSDSAISVRDKINKWFFNLNAEVFVGTEEVPPAYFSIATGWQSAYYLKNFPRTLKKLYFVQDFEPWFYARGSEYAFAEETYTFNFVGITAGKWLAEKLNNEYSMTTFPLSFSYDKDIYRPILKRDPSTKRIFFYARPPTQRRGFELGLLAIKKVLCRHPDLHVIFAGWDVSGYNIPFRHLNAGVVDIRELPDLYSQCDVALVLSFSNLSLLPLELMACGTPIVSNDGPWNEWLLNNENCILTNSNPSAIADGICKILENESEAMRLRNAGLSTAQATSWENEADKFRNILESIARD